VEWDRLLRRRLQAEPLVACISTTFNNDYYHLALGFACETNASCLFLERVGVGRKGFARESTRMGQEQTAVANRCYPASMED